MIRFSAERVAFRYQTRRLYARLLEAMSLGDARKTLGFPPDSNPSPEEVHKAYRTMAFSNHPDRGGDPTKMVEINVAKDILEGKERPTGGGGYRDPSPPTSYETPKQKKPDPIRVSWDEAKRSAGVPNADWKFKTSGAYGGYGDTGISGFVACGKLGEQLVFVAVENYYTANAFTGLDVNEWWMKVLKTAGTFRDVAPKAIRQLFDQFPHLKKKYNAKVEILPDGITFDKLQSFHGRAVSFKDAMALVGEIDQNDPWAQRKVTIQVVVHSRGLGNPYGVELVVNGKSYKLREDNADKMQTNRPDILRTIFGNYYYPDSKKMLTKSKNGPKVMQWMVDNFRGEPDDLMAALKAAMGKS